MKIFVPRNFTCNIEYIIHKTLIFSFADKLISDLLYTSIYIPVIQIRNIIILYYIYTTVISVIIIMISEDVAGGARVEGRDSESGTPRPRGSRREIDPVPVIFYLSPYAIPIFFMGRFRKKIIK